MPIELLHLQTSLSERGGSVVILDCPKSYRREKSIIITVIIVIIINNNGGEASTLRPKVRPGRVGAGEKLEELTVCAWFT